MTKKLGIFISFLLSLEYGEFSDRASQEEGWASFCNGKKNRKGRYYKDEFYKKAKLLNKQPYKKGSTTFHFDEEGSYIYTD